MKISTIFIYAIVAILFFIFLLLSWWQYQRGIEKQAMMDRAVEQLSAKPITASAITTTADTSLDLKQIVLSIDSIKEVNGKPIMLDNKTREGRVGVEIVQPLRISSGWLLVNYGWVPWSRGSPLPNDYNKMVSEQITGRLRLWPDKGFTLGEQEYGEKLPELLSWLDYHSLLSYFDNQLLPYIIYIDSDHSNAENTGWRFSGTVLPEKHYSYAVQWLLMAVALCVLVIYSTLRSKQPRDKQ